MPQTLEIDNVDDAVVEELSQRAMKHGRTLEAEHRAILVEALNGSAVFDELASKLRHALAGRAHTQSERLVRENREER